MTPPPISARDYPRCERCGHYSEFHTTRKCANAERDPRHYPPCDCPGWKLDPNWPPRERAA